MAIFDRIEHINNTYILQDKSSGYTSNTGTISGINLNGSSVHAEENTIIPIGALSDIIYPVGCYYETSDSTFDPNTAWGGTWELTFDGNILLSSGLTSTTNLLDNPTADAGQTHVAYSIADFNLNTSMIEGEMYTVIAKVNTSSEKTGVGFYHSGGNNVMPINKRLNSASYSFAPINDEGIYSTCFVATKAMANFTSGSGHGFCRVYATEAGTRENPIGMGSATPVGSANVDWIKIQRGCLINTAGGSDSYSFTPSFTIGDHTITTSEIKAHDHGSAGKTFYLNGRQRYASSGAAASSLSAIVHELTAMGVSGSNYGGSGISYLQCSTVSQTGYGDVITLNFDHTHTSVGGGGSHTHVFDGATAQMDTMQPYIAVNRWHKTGAATWASFENILVQSDYYVDYPDIPPDGVYGYLDSNGEMHFDACTAMLIWIKDEEYPQIYLQAPGDISPSSVTGSIMRMFGDHFYYDVKQYQQYHIISQPINISYPIMHNGVAYNISISKAANTNDTILKLEYGNMTNVSSCLGWSVQSTVAVQHNGADTFYGILDRNGSIVFDCDDALLAWEEYDVAKLYVNGLTWLEADDFMNDLFDFVQPNGSVTMYTLLTHDEVEYKFSASKIPNSTKAVFTIEIV